MTSGYVSGNGKIILKNLSISLDRTNCSRDFYMEILSGILFTTFTRLLVAKYSCMLESFWVCFRKWENYS
jgi:hypothetical protein